MAVLEYTKRPRRYRPKETLNAATQKATRSLIITLALMITALSVVFIISTNDSTQRGYTLEQLQLKNEALKDVNTALSTKITKTTSFSFLEESTPVEEMEKSDIKTFVTPEDNMVE